MLEKNKARLNKNQYPIEGPFNNNEQDFREDKNLQ